MFFSLFTAEKEWENDTVVTVGASPLPYDFLPEIHQNAQRIEKTLLIQVAPEDSFSAWRICQRAEHYAGLCITVIANSLTTCARGIKRIPGFFFRAVRPGFPDRRPFLLRL